MEDADGRIRELIEAGALAGAYLALARDMPGAERGLMKLWDKWHQRSTALCGELAGRVAARPLSR